MNIAGRGLFYSAEQELPSVGFRAVNEGYTQSYDVVDQRAGGVHPIGGDVDVERSFVDRMAPEARSSKIERGLSRCSEHHFRTTGMRG